MLPKKTDWRIVDRRLKELYNNMKEPYTLEELAIKVNRPKRAVYKDIAKLGRIGCKIGNNLNIWWIEE